MEKKSVIDESLTVHSKEKEESRSKRVSILVRPTVYAAAHKKCKRLNISVNEAVNQFFESWIKE